MIFLQGRTDIVYPLTSKPTLSETDMTLYLEQVSTPNAEDRMELQIIFGHSVLLQVSIVSF